MIHSKNRDFELAYELHQQNNCLGLTENAILPENRNKENYKPRTLIDQTLELIDPTPNIHTLFVQFNERFFWNVLLPVEVKWSNRMTSCAGICSFHPRNRQCIITLSAPLLKLRPRKDLVETLLHEMIHGYLFLTNNNRDRDGHGPEFCKHMYRINKEAGTKITIYHSFHDEVRLYQQHWWRCNGPCQKKAPYFGTVRRAMNRAPGPSDFWWKEHQQTCGGQYIKIKEPENFKAKGSKQAKSVPKSVKSPNGMFNWLTKTTPVSTKPKSLENNNKLLNEFKKLGNNTNNVHGWGTGGPNTVNTSQKSNSPSSTLVSNKSKFSSSGILGGSKTGQSNLLDRFYSNSQSHGSNINTVLPKKPINLVTNSPVTKKGNSNNSQSQKESQIKFVECPICSNFILNDDINIHVDSCSITKNEKTKTMIRSNDKSVSSQEKTDYFSPVHKRKNDTHIFSNKPPKLNKLENSTKTNCPVCSKTFELVDINEHLDKCLLETDKQDNNSISNLDDTNDKNETLNGSIISISSTSSSTSSSSLNEDLKDSPLTPKLAKNKIATSHNCLVCNAFIPSGTSLTDHLEDCIGNVFKDDLSLPIDCDNNEISEISETSSAILIDENNKYPCPVCMQLILESFMNQHLDICLKSS
ncbi:DNA-dependent metalloprotease SPRTN isoform X1 [Megachile rotundata]|uniref:DNA-dependent metalloprotease SPRTN isoform X1 n=2 Tax=Megachile rotundata TaxID=143995 RepID=UPI003FD6996B